VSKEIFGYARVSTKEQNLERQLVELRKYVPKEENIYNDKKSGKDFERSGYKLLKEKVRTGDELYPIWIFIFTFLMPFICLKINKNNFIVRLNDETYFLHTFFQVELIKFDFLKEKIPLRGLGTIFFAYH
jgi:hypothetical protein